MMRFNDEAFMALYMVLFLAVAIMLIAFGVYQSRKYQKKVRAAAKALGDTYFETGVPTQTWKKYARSFPEYERLVHALAASGDFSHANVSMFVSSFTGTMPSLPGEHNSSNYSDPFSTDNLSPGNIVLGDSLGFTSNDTLSSYHHDSDFGKTPGSGY